MPEACLRHDGRGIRAAFAGSSMTVFAELVAATNFSFLRGAAHAHEMVGQAAELGLAALGIADRNTLAGEMRTPLVATNDVVYHHPDRKPLADVLACIREKCTIFHAGYRLEANAERHLKPGIEMARLFAQYPQAVARSLEIVSRVQFSLDELRYEYPDE